MQQLAVVGRSQATLVPGGFASPHTRGERVSEMHLPSDDSIIVPNIIPIKRIIGRDT